MEKQLQQQQVEDEVQQLVLVVLAELVACQRRSVQSLSLLPPKTTAKHVFI